MKRYLSVVAMLAVFLLTGCRSRNEEPNNTKPAAEIEPLAGPAGSKREERTKTDDELLPGTWKVVSVEQDGKKPSTEQPRMIKWIVNGDRKAVVVRYEGDKVVGLMSYKLDLSTQPKSIDMEVSHSPTWKGIYLLEGDRLTISYGEVRIKEDASMPGGGQRYSERPKGFAISPGSGQLVIVLQRATASEAKVDSRPTNTKLVKSKPLVTIRGHTGRIGVLAFSPDGKYLASARNQQNFGSAPRIPGDLKIWDAATGKEVSTLAGQKSSVVALAFSPDGKRIAGACEADSTLRVWDTKTGDIIHNLTGNRGDIRKVAFSPDGEKIAAAGADICAWNVTTGKQLHALSFSKAFPLVQSVAFSRDSKCLVAALTDGSGGKILKLETRVLLDRPGEAVTDGTSGKVLKGWDATTGAEFKLAGNVFSVSFSPDGEHLAGSFGKNVLIWNVATGKELRSIPVDGSAIFCSDWQRFASLHFDSNILEGEFDQWSEVQVWETATGKPLFSFGRLPPLVYSLALSADGKLLALGTGDWGVTSEVTIWDTIIVESTAGKPSSDPDPPEPLKKEPMSANEAAAVKALEKLGASLRVDTSRPGKPVVGVQLQGEKVTDASLKHLKELKSLETLNLSHTKVTDAGFKRLKEFEGLESLDLSYTPVTGEGLQELKDLRFLNSLDLRFAMVTDAAFAELKELKGLLTLRLGGTPITGAGLNHLKGLQSLQLLDLSGSNLTDAGLKELKEQSLETLNLSFTKVTDAGLKHLKELHSVHTLDLSNTQITDAGLMELKDVKGLQSLYLMRTKVTDAGVEKFNAGRPLSILR